MLNSTASGFSKSRIVRLAALAGCVAASAPTALAQTYHMRMAGPAGTESEISALDQAGRCVGWYTSSVGNAHVAYSFNHGVVTSVPPLLADSQGEGYAIGVAGSIVGVSYDLGELTVRSFMNTGGISASLGNFAARGANQIGDVVGHVTVAQANDTTVDHAARLRAGVITDLLTLQSGSNSYAFATNSRGQIVGRSDTTNDAGTQGALWQDTVPQRVGLGTLGGTFSEAYALNDLNTVVGVSTTAAGEYRATRFGLNAAGYVISRTNLGVLGAPAGVPAWSTAFGVNNAGRIVGTSSGKGALWVNDRIYDLNTLASPPAGWRIEVARAINDAGTIAAQAFGADGYRHAVLLVPCPADADRDGTVSVNDLFTFLSAWFSSSGPCPSSTGVPCPADADFNGTVSVNDLFTFLSAWFVANGSDCAGQ